MNLLKFNFFINENVWILKVIQIILKYSSELSFCLLVLPLEIEILCQNPLKK